MNKVYNGNKGLKRGCGYLSMIQCVHKPFSDLSLPSSGLCLLTCIHFDSLTRKLKYDKSLCRLKPKVKWY